MRQLTENEIARTAFKAVRQEQWKSPYGYTHMHRDHNEMCPYCKNEDTDIIHDTVSLAPFEQYYSDKVQKYTVVHCFCCNAVWSFYVQHENRKHAG